MLSPRATQTPALGVAIESLEDASADVVWPNIWLVSTIVLLEEALDLSNGNPVSPISVQLREELLDRNLGDLVTVQRLDRGHEFVILQRIFRFRFVQVHLEPFVDSSVPGAKRTLHLSQLCVKPSHQLVVLPLLLCHLGREPHRIDVLDLAWDAEVLSNLRAFSIDKMKLAL